MKIILVLFLLVFNFFASELTPISQNPKANLEAISKHAIKIGSGEDTVAYLFVDPLCSYSRELMKKIYDNKMLLLTNTYYVFLYRLPRLNSEKAMHYILEAKNQKEMLLDIMVYEDVIDIEDFTPKDSTIIALKNIANVAKTLDMTVRPYMISFDKDSKYCRVSEGTAACLDEFN